MDPKIIHGVFSLKRFEEVSSYCNRLVLSSGINQEQRTMFDSSNNPVLQMFGQELLPLARELFNNPNLSSVKTTFAHYEGHQGVLGKHVDNNTNVCLLDVCVYEDLPWGIVVENQEYIFPPNSGVAFHSGQLEHWRKPNPDLNNKTGVLLAYFDEIPLDIYSRPVGEKI